MAKRKKKRARRKPAENQDEVRRPKDWDKAISCAYLRLLGASQEKAALEAGAGERTLRTWEGCSWWKEALLEARQRWLKGGDALAMRGLLRALNDPNEYAQMSRYWSDRRIPELSPPKNNIELTGKNDGPIEVLAIRERITSAISRLVPDATGTVVKREK